jgi:hypothetical protein
MPNVLLIQAKRDIRIWCVFRLLVVAFFRFRGIAKWRDLKGEIILFSLSFRMNFFRVFLKEKASVLTEAFNGFENFYVFL